MRISPINNIWNNEYSTQIAIPNKTGLYNAQKPQDQFCKSNIKNCSSVLPFKGFTEKVVMEHFNEMFVGFEKQKLQLNEILLEPFFKSRVSHIFKRAHNPIPPSILLHSPDKLLIRNFNDATQKTITTFFPEDVTRISDIPNEQFLPRIAEILEANKPAKPEYPSTHLIIIENIENYLGMNYNQAKRLRNFNYDSQDINILQRNNNSDNINYFKSLLDYCHTSRRSGGYETSFLFTSSRPHLIHPDFRSGKMEKIEIPRLNDDETVQLFIELLRAKIPNLMNFNTEQLTKIKETCQTDAVKGAFNYDDLNRLAQEIQLRNKGQDFDFIIKLTQGTPRAFSPEDIIRQERITRVFSYKPTEYEILKGKYENGDITEVEQKLFEELTAKNKIKIQELEEKEKLGTITILEKEELKKLKELDD